MDYRSAGVDIEIADKFVDRIKSMVLTTQDDRVVSGVGGFAALYTMDDKRLLAASTDGVGTKIKLAIDLGIHDTIGIDLVAMCVNDLICTGARPLFFLDYFASGKLDLGVGVDVIAGIVKGCREARMALIGGETAEMPGMYLHGDYDLAGFSVGEVYRDDLVTGENIRPDQTLIGIASTGFHSNGYSLVRKLLERTEASLEIKKAALTPTRIYVDLIQGLREHLGNKLTGMANITGSGLLNIPRMNLNYSYEVDLMPELSELPVPMSTLLNNCGLSELELFKTFNMGVGFVVATSDPMGAMKWLKQKGERAWILGRVSDQEPGEIFYQGQKL